MSIVQSIGRKETTMHITWQPLDHFEKMESGMPRRERYMIWTRKDKKFLSLIKRPGNRKLTSRTESSGRVTRKRQLIGTRTKKSRNGENVGSNAATKQLTGTMNFMAGI